MAAPLTATVRAATRAARKPRARSAVLTVTRPAAEKIRELLQTRPDAIGMRVGVRTRGCSGNAFTLDFADKKEKLDEEVNAYGVKVLVDGNAIMKVLNSTMDYVEEDLRSEFVFENPQVKAMCGCGESWHT